MSFTEVISLEADVTYSLGKLNKKTGKKDPSSVEGYYIGKREVDTKLGKSLIHFFKTKTGNVAVWGSTNLNHKLAGIGIGTMTKVDFVGMKPTPRGEMRSFKVAQDKANFIEVAVEYSEPSLDEDGNEDDNGYSNNGTEEDADPEDEESEESPLAASSTQPRRQTVQELLNSRKAKK